MCVTNHHDMTLAVKSSIKHQYNQPTDKVENMRNSKNPCTNSLSFLNTIFYPRVILGGFLCTQLDIFGHHIKSLKSIYPSIHPLIHPASLKLFYLIKKCNFELFN